ncbi:MAG: toll/interleukin-1 receptor domain-containing protein, partial [Anaerolineales bacterium]|nr:toll/interleukin-1 receptor domain-containing protein [Anaerolineales bacterium]
MTRPLQVFLCHASQDKPEVWKLHRYLKSRGVKPWLDVEDLLPGEDWEVEIPKALFSSDIILVCLSKNSVNKEGYVQKEIAFALDKAL